MGKTTFLTEFGFRVSRGEPFLGWKTKAGSVIFLLFEDLAEEVREHLKLLGAKASDRTSLLISESLGQDALARLEKSKRHIREFLKAQSAPVLRKKIEKGVVGTTGATRPALNALYDDCEVLRRGAGRKGDPYLYKLAR